MKQLELDLRLKEIAGRDTEYPTRVPEVPVIEEIEDLREMERKDLIYHWRPCPYGG